MRLAIAIAIAAKGAATHRKVAAGDHRPSRERNKRAWKGGTRVLSSMIVRPRTPPGVGTPLRANDSSRPPALEMEVKQASLEGAFI